MNMKERLEKLEAADTPEKQAEYLGEVLVAKLDKNFQNTLLHICKLESQGPLAAAVNLAFVAGLIAATGCPAEVLGLQLSLVKTMFETGAEVAKPKSKADLTSEIHRYAAEAKNAHPEMADMIDRLLASAGVQPQS